MARNWGYASTINSRRMTYRHHKYDPFRVATVLILLLIAFVPSATSARVCCNPGSDGDLNLTAGTHILNSYYPGTADAAAGTSTLTLGSINSGGASTPLAQGDQVLIIQMQDATIDSTNTDAYGDGAGGDGIATGSTIRNSGLYEFGCVSSITASTLTLAHPLQHSYRATSPSTFQVIRVPQYNDLRIRSGRVVTAPAWDGASGGIVALDATDRITFRGSGTINVDGLGFRGGPSLIIPGSPSDTAIYTATTRTNNGGSKGEGIAGTPATISGSSGYSGGDYARGAPGNAGGGGNEHNAGGGGGSNGGSGGTGGSTWIGTGGSMVGGFGGAAFSATSTRLIMGGGGGEGAANNFGDTSGGVGGGIVILHADTIRGNSGFITANGTNGGSTAQDGSGGGGAGGSILALAASDPNNLLNLTLTADGGGGGSSNWPANDQHGGGGGGGGGVIFTSHPVTSTSVTGGANGLAGDGSGTPAYITHDATSGADGAADSASTSESDCLGVSKRFAKADTNDLESPWTIYMDLTFENFSNTQMASLSAADDLDALFGATGASTWTFTAISTLIIPTGSLRHNATYDGSSDVELLNGGTLEAGDTATIRVQFELNHSSGSFDNQVTASCNTSVESYSDLSVDGSDPDGTDNDGIPDESSVSTLDVSTLPVSLAAFSVTQQDNWLTFTWTTTTESANLGFHLDGKTPSLPWIRLTTTMIASLQPDALTPQTYSHTMPAGDETQFNLIAVDRFGKTTRHGPFALNTPYGNPPQPAPINWHTIKAEQKHRPMRTYQQRKNTNSSASSLVLKLSETGIYRIDFAALTAAGMPISLATVPQLALTQKGQPVPIYIATPDVDAGVDGYIEFYGQAIADSLYTHTNAYVLQIDGTRAQRIATTHRPLPPEPPITVGQQTVAVEQNRAYSFSAPIDDPWYDTKLLAVNAPVSHHFPLAIDSLVPSRGPIDLTIELYGGTALPQRPDHHVVVELNGAPLADTTFDGLSATTLEVSVPPGLLQEGQNHLTLALPHDIGAEFDLVYLEGYRINYPRQLIAQNNALTFTAAGPAFQVQGLSSPRIIVYRLDTHRISRLTPHVSQSTHPTTSGHYTATFRGTQTPAQYVLTTEDALRRPQSIAPVLNDPSLKVGPAAYVIITHAQFRHDLGRLVQARQADGYTVKVVDVADIYAQFGDHIVHAKAIRDYITYAHQTLGTEFVLLVGGDTYDYFDNLGHGSVSFVPTLYAPTDDVIRYTPTDTLLADTNADNLPDVHLGRLPVRTVSELQTVIDKTLAYNPAPTTAVFAADRSPAGTFSTLSDQLQTLLPADWQVATAYSDDLTGSGARSALLTEFNQGPAFVNFVGHSGPLVWSFDNIFASTDALTLQNIGQPAIVVQWGCWNTYHVAPAYHTLGHRLLLSGPQGAAAILGSATLTQTQSDQALGPLVLAQLFKPGQPIGQAITEAKQRLARSHPRMLDVLLGWTLLGDPALVIVQ